MLTASVEYISFCPPAHYSLAFDPYLYNQESFLRLKEYEVQSFYAVDHKKETINARIHFAVQPSPDGSLRAVSLPQLPFGSLEHSVSTTLAQLTDFIAFVCEHLAQQGVTSVEIRDCIPAYRVDQAELLHQVLSDQGFAIKEEVANHHIPVDEKRFSEKIHRMEIRRLKKCLQLGLVFRQESLDNLEYVYQFIQQCRIAKGWKLSLTLLELTRMTDQFPDAYLLFSVYYQHQRIAATVAILVNSQILYNFYPASHPDYQSLSPIVYLFQQLYSSCQKRGIQIIDLGTSASLSLENFKAHIGGISSEKKAYCLHL